MNRKRKPIKANSSQVVKIIKEESIKITYQDFFQQCLKKGLVDSWQEDEIRAFFNHSGLTDKESADEYRDMLAKY